jgi:hypothetical protein
MSLVFNITVTVTLHTLFITLQVFVIAELHVSTEKRSSSGSQIVQKLLHIFDESNSALSV